ncbi:MAG TPA: hypothetical protein VM661_12410 [Candidatus Sulfotelmatobacter sp.]|jgi:hypothetical protein|nr:hypothetical protein [Candidatus Sulfotelmatobacter sp.]
MSESSPVSAKSKPSEEEMPTHVVFEHPIFAKFEGCHFVYNHQANEPVMCVTVGNNKAALPFPGVKREFALKDNDCHMLDLLSEGLKYVSGLAVGDPLPKEIITGEATWELTQRHVVVAHQRISMQLVNWLTGVDDLITDPDALVQLADDPATKKKVNEAFGEAAERLGIGRENKQEMLKYVEKLTHELAYIEALRDKFGDVQNIQKKVDGLRKVYSRERSVCDMIDQIRKLFQIAVNDFKRRFLEVDAQTGEILSVLKNLENQVRFIRGMRDDLHIRLMAWEDLIGEWKKVEVCVSYQISNILGRVYQFLAPRFMKVDDWVLMNKLREQKEETKKKAAGKVLVW